MANWNKGFLSAFLFAKGHASPQWPLYPRRLSANFTQHTHPQTQDIPTFKPLEDNFQQGTPLENSFQQRTYSLLSMCPNEKKDNFLIRVDNNEKTFSISDLAVGKEAKSRIANEESQTRKKRFDLELFSFSEKAEPLAMMEMVEEGDFEFTLPFEKNFIETRILKVRNDAQLWFRLKVEKGNINFAASHVRVKGISVYGIPFTEAKEFVFDQDGQINVKLRMGLKFNVSNVLLGQKHCPRKLKDLISILRTQQNNT